MTRSDRATGKADRRNSSGACSMRPPLPSPVPEADSCLRFVHQAVRISTAIGAI